MVGVKAKARVGKDNFERLILTDGIQPKRHLKLDRGGVLFCEFS